MNQLERVILPNTKGQYMKVSNSLAGNATINQLERNNFLNIKRQYMNYSTFHEVQPVIKSLYISIMQNNKRYRLPLSDLCMFLLQGTVTCCWGARSVGQNNLPLSKKRNISGTEHPMNLGLVCKCENFRCGQEKKHLFVSV